MTKSIIGITAGLVLSCMVNAEISIRVVDNDGKPVENAVIELLPDVENGAYSATSKESSAHPAVMDQVNKQFLPSVLLVEAHQPVVFPNSDQVRHHVYSFSKPNEFEIKLYSGDQADPVSFNHEGVVVLGCNIHDQMVGYIYVHQNKYIRQTDQHGMAIFDEPLSISFDEKKISVWHSRLSANKTDRLFTSLANKHESVWEVPLTLLPEIQQTSRKFKLRYP